MRNNRLSLGSALLVSTLALTACGPRQAGSSDPSAGAPGGKAKTRPQASASEVRAQMQGINFRIDPEVVMEVRRLRGALEPVREGKPPWFDDPSSFRLRIDEGEIAMSAASLTAMMNHYLFAGPNAPVKDVMVEIRDGKLIQTSTLNKKVPIRATLEGDVSPTPDGDLRFHPTKIKAGDLPVKGLLDLFDIELSEMIKPQEGKGLRIEKDDLILDPERLLPPPRMKGRVVAVRIEGDHLVQVFGGGKEGKRLSPSLSKAKNYMYFRGGSLSFGRLTMADSDLQIVDADPKDPFDFFLAQFSKQLVAGYSKTMSDKGLVSYMPDSGETGKELSP
jgi:hypothetical protein